MELRFFLQWMLLGILSSVVFGTAYAIENANESPIGYWKTIDDTTGKPKSIVQIWKTQDNVLMGKVIKLFSAEKRNPDVVCSECKGDKHNQPVVGMVIISGLQAKETSWESGEILDPENGKTYSCALKTLENGKRLQVRGYIGLPLLGRSQTWERIDLMSG